MVSQLPLSKTTVLVKDKDVRTSKDVKMVRTPTTIVSLMDPHHNVTSITLVTDTVLILNLLKMVANLSIIGQILNVNLEWKETLVRVQI